MTITLTTEELRGQILGQPEIEKTLRLPGGNVYLYITCCIFVNSEACTDDERELFLHQDGVWRDDTQSGLDPKQTTVLLFHAEDEAKRALADIKTALV